MLQQAPGTLQQTPGMLQQDLGTGTNQPFTSMGAPSPFGGTRQGFPSDTGFSERPAMTGPLAFSPPGSLPPVDQAVDPEAYVCGPGDVLELNFWGLQNFRYRVTVDLEGRAFVPRIGFVSLAGQSLSKVRATLRESVGRFYPRLGFDLALAEPRTFLVQAVGDVGRPGTFPARAVERVASLLLRAGGLRPHASKRRIEVKRRDGSVLAVDLERFQLEGDVKFNPFLLDGDVVHVPFEALTAKVDGAVNRPGRYELTGRPRPGRAACSLAGGLSPSATRLMPVAVVRRGATDAQDLTLLPFAEDGQLAGVRAPAGRRHPLPELRRAAALRHGDRRRGRRGHAGREGASARPSGSPSSRGTRSGRCWSGSAESARWPTWAAPTCCAAASRSRSISTRWSCSRT